MADLILHSGKKFQLANLIGAPTIRVTPSKDDDLTATQTESRKRSRSKPISSNKFV